MEGEETPKKKPKPGRPTGIRLTQKRVKFKAKMQHLRKLRSVDTKLTSSSDTGTSDTEYRPTPSKKWILTRDQDEPVLKERISRMPCEDHYFVGLASSVMDFVEELSNDVSCKTTACGGKLIPKSVLTKGLGGAIQIAFGCSECNRGERIFSSTLQVEESRRNVISLALHVAMFIGGSHYADIRRCLGLGMGIQVLTPSRFYEIVGLLFPITQDMLKRQIEAALQATKELAPHAVGSFTRLITTSDGAWLTRGKFSKNFTFTIRNFLNGAVLSALHLCQRGDDEIAEEHELYEGTSKSMEGYAAKKCFGDLKKAGAVVEVNWQDADSSSGNSFKSVFPEDGSKVMLCANHVARAHRKQLGILASQRTFKRGTISKHKVKYPEIESTECVCKNRNHSKNCGCMSANFIRQASINHFCAVVAAGDARNPDTYADTMRKLGQHHAKNEHEWEGGKCDFHPDKVCSCGECDEEELKCEGKPYSSKFSLSCPFHLLAYRIECDARAEQATEVIHPELGRGHSNWPEAGHHQFTVYRRKDMSLFRLHYMTSTNLGLLQSNLVWMNSQNEDYHWILEIFAELKLPVLDCIRDACAKDIQSRKKRAQQIKDQKVKDKRVQMKLARALENEDRKQWTKEQSLIHSYGDEEEDITNADDSDAVKEALSLMHRSNASQSSDIELEISATSSSPLVHQAEQSTSSDMEAGPSTSSGIEVAQQVQVVDTVAPKVKRCRCGSSTHQRVSHRDCPLKELQK